MSKCSDIREICGDYAFDVEYSADNKFTMFFNSRCNAEIVKQCIEVDDSVPNVATVVDFVEVVRCKGCKHYNTSCCADGFGWCEKHNRGEMDNHFCSHGETQDN